MSGYPQPPYGGPPQAPYAVTRSYDRPWSGLAIAAFVLSLLGFLGFTAVLGIILGIAGIFATRGGTRRGVGLAIAAIPISLVTGAISLFVVLGTIFLIRVVAEFPKKLEPILMAKQFDSLVIENFRHIASTKLSATVSDLELESWLASVRTKHGSLVKIEGFDTSVDPAHTVVLSGRFVNGSASIRVDFKADSLTDIRLEDLAIGGSSLLEFASDGTAEELAKDPDQPAAKPPDEGGP